MQLASPARTQATILLPAQQVQAPLLSWQPRMSRVSSLGPPPRLQARARQAGAPCRELRSCPRTTSSWPGSAQARRYAQPLNTPNLAAINATLLAEQHRLSVTPAQCGSSMCRPSSSSAADSQSSVISRQSHVVAVQVRLTDDELRQRSPLEVVRTALPSELASRLLAELLQDQANWEQGTWWMNSEQALFGSNISRSQPRRSSSCSQLMRIACPCSRMTSAAQL